MAKLHFIFLRSTNVRLSDILYNSETTILFVRRSKIGCERPLIPTRCAGIGGLSLAYACGALYSWTTRSFGDYCSFWFIATGFAVSTCGGNAMGTSLDSIITQLSIASLLTK